MQILSKTGINITNVNDIQKIFEDITGQEDINKAFNELIEDYIKAKIFQLKIQLTQIEIKWGMTYEEFEKESVNFPNGSSYEIEQEYYKWGEIVTELDHFKKLITQWS